MRHLRYCTRTLGLIALLAVASLAEQAPPHGQRYSFEAFRARMEDPQRAQWQKPDEVVRMLHLRRGSRIADIGAGTGYFSVRLARAVGTSGRVYAVDIDRRAVQYMRRRFRRAHLPQAIAVEGTPTDPKLPQRVDLVFICDTWHHIEDRVTYARTLRRSLRPSGRVVIVDFKPEADPAIGPPREMRLSAEQITGELQQAGFHVVVAADFLPLQYVLTATSE